MIKQLQAGVNYFGNLILNDLPAKCWIAGGAVRDYFSGEKMSSDIDIYFPNEKEFEKARKWLNRGKGYKKIFENSRVLSVLYKKRKYDLVKVYFPNPQETINNFDFTVSCFAVDKEQVYTHETAFIDLAKRRLVINKLPFPISSMQRLQKYILKGFLICNGGLLEIAQAINSLDLRDPRQNSIEFYPNGEPRFVRLD
ncbi:MAG: hypothetical protein WC976_06465 [Caldisericia bacterium]